MSQMGHFFMEERIKKICDDFLNISYKGMVIKECVIVPTFKFDNDENEWVPNSKSIFLTINRNGYVVLDMDVSRKFESYMGFEFCIDLV